MRPKDLIALQSVIRDRSRSDLMKKHPDVVLEVRKECDAEIAALKAEVEALKAENAKLKGRRSRGRRGKKAESAGDGDKH